MSSRATKIFSSKRSFLGPLFLNQWDSCESMMRDFQITNKELKGVEILLASYDSGYEGDAFVLFIKNGKFYEVHGSHCSCFGLEGQWTPEETTLASLRYRLNNGTLGQHYEGGLFSKELLEVLTIQGQT